MATLSSNSSNCHEKKKERKKERKKGRKKLCVFIEASTKILSVQLEMIFNIFLGLLRG